MTKYYFISYMYKDDTGINFTSCLYRAKNRTLKDIYFDLARFNNVSTRSVVITCLKDLTEEEYEMLKGEENE